MYCFQNVTFRMFIRLIIKTKHKNMIYMKQKYFMMGCAIALLPMAAHAQYPQLTDEAKQKSETLHKQWEAHSDSAWAVASLSKKQKKDVHTCPGLRVHTTFVRQRFQHSQVPRVAVCSPLAVVAVRCSL